MRILITGATGFIGRHIVEALGEEGHELVLTARAVPPLEQNPKAYDWRAIDFASAHLPEHWQEIVKDIDVVINAVGIFSQSKNQRFADLHDKAPRALFKAAQRAGVKRIIQISALGTEAGATSAYHLSKKRADDALAKKKWGKGGPEWVILRPSVIIGNEGVSWRFFKALAALPLVPVIGRGEQILQPLGIEDVTKAVLNSILREQAVGHRINLVGADEVTLEHYLQQLSNWLGLKKFHPVHIAYGPAKILALAAPLIGVFPFNRDAVTMLKEARRYDGEDCQQRLGFVPRGLSDYLSQHPPTRAERNEARQYFLRPLLRIALAFMWIMAGIASLFLTPHEQSLALLAKLGLQGGIGQVALYGAAFLDMILGLFLLLRLHIKSVARVQIALIAGYTLALGLVAPVMWSDPFGVLVKNIPIIVATMLMMSWQEE